MKMYKIAQNKYQDMYDFYEEIGDQEEKILHEYFYNHKPGQNMSWQVVPIGRLKKIWQDRIRMGFIRDEAGLDAIIDQLITILARLIAATTLAGHGGSMGAEELAREYEYPEIEGDNDDFYFNFLNTQYGSPISDYGLKELGDLVGKIFEADSYDEKMSLVDLMLQVVHQRGDLAALFIEGGASAWDEVREMGEEDLENKEDNEDGELEKDENV